MYKIYVITYHQHDAAHWYSYKIFNPTGKWKLEIRGNKTTMFLQHKGFIFTEWVEEGNINIQWEETFIKECGK